MKKSEKAKVPEKKNDNQKMPRIVAFVPARVSSSRLPKKHFEKIGDLSMLEWIHRRLVSVACIEELVLAMPDESGIDELAQYGEDMGFSSFVFNGRVDDIVGRLTTAANYYGAEYCLLVSGDCPLISVEHVKQMCNTVCEKFNQGVKTNGVYFSKRKGKVHGLQGVKLTTRGVWQLADMQSMTAYDRENQFPLIDPGRGITDTNYVRLKGADVDYFEKSIDFSINTPEQLELHRMYFEQLGLKRIPYNYENVRDTFLRG